MNALSFDGKTQFIHQLDQAVSQKTSDDIVTELRRVLCKTMRESSISVPSICKQPNSTRYARRLLHKSVDLGYSVVAMTWSPGQATPIHDHCGMWCVEGIWLGEIEVVQYELVEKIENNYKFEQRGCINACVGSTGSLIPPHEYHTIANQSEENTAISIHIYSGDMTSCQVFNSAGDNWFSVETRNLGFD